MHKGDTVAFIGITTTSCPAPFFLDWDKLNEFYSCNQTNILHMQSFEKPKIDEQRAQHWMILANPSDLKALGVNPGENPQTCRILNLTRIMSCLSFAPVPFWREVWLSQIWESEKHVLVPCCLNSQYIEQDDQNAIIQMNTMRFNAFGSSSHYTRAVVVGIQSM